MWHAPDESLAARRQIDWKGGKVTQKFQLVLTCDLSSQPSKTCNPGHVEFISNLGITRGFRHPAH